MKFSSPRRWLPWLLLVLLLIFTARALLVGKPVGTVTVQRQDLVETVISSGRVITPERIALGAELVGSLAQVLVEDGDRVERGQVLARIQDAEQRAAVEQARRAQEEAQAGMERLSQVGRPVAEQALLQAEANLSQALAEFERVQRLAQAGFYNLSRLDEARRAADSARAAREAARAQARGNRPDGVEARLAAARLAQATASRALAEARLDNTVIRAPASGVVTRKLVEAGDIVTQGKKLFELAADGETQLILQIDEKNLGRLGLGQQAEVVADAYPGQRFAAEIFHIAPAVDVQRGSVEVKLRVPAPPAFLKQDMTVSAEVRVGEHSQALSLPTACVRDAASAKPWVLVLMDGRAVRRDIRLGLRATDRVEVAAGLREGEVVILTRMGVAPGDRVRPES
ncbi:MAG TPA: efflux RND transporter periplasmic adaptor subunit [Thiobacillaceae bacterium]|nr:efflux RND transporter periplasmic adaptor subunit [Thiobacillaceae bacterium]HNU63414.1 efflux RND transporter periplasmic adaptor subunit [Thiobacillaceae bacterium]